MIPKNQTLIFLYSIPDKTAHAWKPYLSQRPQHRGWHTYITHTWEQPPPPPPPARLLYTVYIKNLSNDVKWLYILYIMETQIRRLTPFIISIMKSLVIPAIGLALSSVIYSRITIFFALNKVSRGDWLWNTANNKVENNGAVSYVESSLTVHNPLFFGQ